MLRHREMSEKLFNMKFSQFGWMCFVMKEYYLPSFYVSFILLLQIGFPPRLTVLYGQNSA